MLKHKSKGQGSFELIIVLSIVLVISATIMIDANDESTTTLILASVRNTVAQEISAFSLEKSKCANTFLESMSLSDNTINVNVNGDAECKPSATVVSNKVEKVICSVEPDNNNEISCVGKTYTLNIV